LKFGGKIVAALVHVNSDSHHSQVWSVVLCAHLDKHAAYFAPVYLNVVGQLDRGLETDLAANHVRNGLDRPNREPSRFCERDIGS
jgi:hypothetical protein